MSYFDFMVSPIFAYSKISPTKFNGIYSQVHGYRIAALLSAAMILAVKFYLGAAHYNINICMLFLYNDLLF